MHIKLYRTDAYVVPTINRLLVAILTRIVVVNHHRCKLYKIMSGNKGIQSLMDSFLLFSEY